MDQQVVDEKSNEITAIPKVLESIEIKGQVVTIDAMRTQTAVVETIRERRAGEYYQTEDIRRMDQRKQ